MSQVRRRDDKKQPRSSGVGGIGGLIVLGGVVAGAALLATLKGRTHKRITSRNSSGQRLPREDGKAVAQPGLLSAIGNPISEETQNGESKWNEEAFAQQKKGDDSKELLPDNKEITEIELENLMESKVGHIQEDMLDYTRDSELLEQNGEVVEENDHLTLENNLPILCEEEEDQEIENVEEVDEKESKDGNGIMRIVDVVDKCSFGITTEFKKDECSNGKVSVDCPGDDELILDMSSLILEKDPSIQDKEKEVEEEVDHEVEGDELAGKVATNHSIELKVEIEEKVFSNGLEHFSPPIQNELHVHPDEEEEGEYELSDKAESRSIGLIPKTDKDECANEKDHFPIPVQDNENSGGQEPHYELDEEDKESSSKVECLPIKLIGEKEEDEPSTQEHFSLKTLAAEDKQVHFPTEVNSHSDGSYEIENQQVNSETNEDVIGSSDGQQSPTITSKEEGDEQSLECSLDTKEQVRPFNMMQLDEFERNDESPNEKTANELMSEQQQMIGSSDGQQSPTITSKEEGDEQSLECSLDTKEQVRPFNMMQLDEFERNDESPNEKTANELMSEQQQMIGSSDGQQSPTITSKEEGDEQSLECSLDTKEQVRPFNMMQLDEFERNDESPNEKTANELMSVQQQEQNVRNEQQEVRNAYVEGDEKMNLKAEEVKFVYGVYGSKDRGLLELVMHIKKSTTMVRSVLVGLVLVFLCHIFAKYSSFNPF